MGFPTLRNAMLGLAVLASTASATISLSNFTPRIDRLPSQCAAVYNSKIEGCVATDFSSSDGSTPVCSAACVQGLVKIQDAVSKSCADADVSEVSIIGVFQNGLGLRALCPGVAVTTKSSTTAQATSTQAPARTSTEAAATTTSSFEMVLSTASSSPGLNSPTRGLTMDPSATGTLTTSEQATNVGPSWTAGATTSRAPNSQLSNAGSGGGSPFDVVAVGSSSQVRIIDMTAASLFATAVVFFACA
ncbi:hypothetical protein NX059_001027 [Plenodomus lindquistii]|nr:hypothetical protein NX059_001027 [Plenodomus lindquistii]